MFRIRKIHDYVLPVNKQAIQQVKDILRAQFDEFEEKDVRRFTDQLLNAAKYRFRTELIVAENLKGKVIGFAFFSYFPDLKFCFLDYLAAGKLQINRGIGGALYERLRQEAKSLDAIGLFFECLPDDPRVCPDPKTLRQNKSRLKFYERYGAMPLLTTLHEKPVRIKKETPPYVVFDPLGRHVVLKRDVVRAVIKAILERKYAGICSPEWNRTVLKSFRDDPVRPRPARYARRQEKTAVEASVPFDKKIILVVNDRHRIHHVKEKGYVESPVRVGTILKELNKTDLFYRIPPQSFPESHITSVHDRGFVSYFKKISYHLKPRESAYPYVFPLRNHARRPIDLIDRAGYYCIDTFTPLNKNAFLAARRAVDCTLTAARRLALGHRLAYALVRPPGHHAEQHVFGGFCYFNSAAVAAHYLSRYGKVAILDIDHHHGNGQQDIFYKRNDVLTASLHIHPRFDYPLFTGFEDERGAGKGRGYNVNVPLPKGINGPRYGSALKRVLKMIKTFQPSFLVVCLGLDSAKGDPTGTWKLLSRDFEINGHLIGSLHLPTLVVQEGGYNNRVLGVNARCFFQGLWRQA